MNIKPTLNYADDTQLDDLFVVKRANEWIRAAKARPMPKMLFGECWLEGELAVLTAPALVNAEAPLASANGPARRERSAPRPT